MSRRALLWISIFALVGVCLWWLDLGTRAPQQDLPRPAQTDGDRARDLEATEHTDRNTDGDGAAKTDRVLRLRVDVRDSTGRPVAGMLVEALPIEAREIPRATDVGLSYTADARRQKTDASGVTEFVVVPGSWLVRANRERRLRPTDTAAARWIRIRESRELRLELQAASAGLDVALRDPHDKPLTGQRVVLQDETRKGPARTPKPRVFVGQVCHRPTAAVTESDLAILDATRCFNCHDNDPPPPTASTVLEDIDPTELHEGRGFALLPGTRAEAWSNEHGVAQFRGIPPGAYRIVLPRLLHGWANLAPDADTTETELRALERKKLTIRSLRRREVSVALQPIESGAVLVLEPVAIAPAEFAALSAWSGIDAPRLRNLLAGRSPVRRTVGYSERTETRDGTGSTSVDAGTSYYDALLPPGTWTMSWRIPARSDVVPARARRIVVGREGHSDDHRVRLSTDGHVATGRFVDREGRAAPGLGVVARRLDGSLLKSSSTDDEGRYEIRGLPSGPFYVCWHTRPPSTIPTFRPDMTKDARRFAGPTQHVVHEISR